MMQRRTLAAFAALALSGAFAASLPALAQTPPKTLKVVARR